METARLLRRLVTDICVRFLDLEIPQEMLIDDGYYVKHQLHPFVEEMPEDWYKDAFEVYQSQFRINALRVGKRHNREEDNTPYSLALYPFVTNWIKAHQAIYEDCNPQTGRVRAIGEIFEDDFPYTARFLLRYIFRCYPIWLYEKVQ